MKHQVKPLDIVCGHILNEADPGYFTAMFGISEAEFVAVVIVRTLGRLGNEWRSISLGDLVPDIVGSGLVRAGIINPIRGRTRLEEDGYIVCDNHGITVQPSFIEKVSERAKPPTEG